MEDFNFIVDYKISMYKREWVTVEAETKEEAIKKLKKERFDYFGTENSEYLPETEEYSPEDRWFIMDDTYTEVASSED